MHTILLAALTLFSTITWVDRNGRPVRSGQNRQRHQEKPKPVEAHRLEDDSVTARSKEMQKSRGYVSDADRKREEAAKKDKAKRRDADLPEAKDCPGLFGLELGAVFDPKSADPLSEDEYAFVPEKPFRSYTRYSVRILPESRRIYEIRAKADASLEKSERDVVLALLETKFKAKARGYSLRFRGETGASDGRTVSVSSTGVVAVDLALKKQLKSERKSSAAAAAAASADDLDAL